MIVLRKMTSGEFSTFAEYSVRDYANDLMTNERMEADAAVERAKKEFADMLPSGADTPGNALMVIEAECRAVGVIWYLYEVTDGVRHAFLNDFIIDPAERRRGYAAAALLEMEADARAHDCTECRLYVWNGNTAAQSLYAKCGFTVFREAEDGVYMRKHLKTP